MYLYGEFGYSGLPSKKWTTCWNGNGSFDCSSNVGNFSTENHYLFSRISFGTLPRADEAVVELRVALSFISGAQAKRNFNVMDASQPADEFLDSTRKAWCNTLDFFTVEPFDGDDDFFEMLMSANYRAMLTPTDYTEEGDVYLGLDKKTHYIVEERSELYPNSTSTSHKVMRFYSDLSFWDTFRTLHPWLLLVDENLAVGILRSVSEMTRQQNGFPKWVLASRDTGSMVGLHGSAIALEGALSGFDKEFDVLGIQQMLLNQATLVSSCCWLSITFGLSPLSCYLGMGYQRKKGSGLLS